MNLTKLKNIILEEVKKSLSEKENIQNPSMEQIVDYLLSDDKEESMNEEKGRTSNSFVLKKDVSKEEVKRFLKGIQNLIKKRNETPGTRGRSIKNNFTDEDIENFADLLTRKEGFTRADILRTISFFQGKPFQAAQKMMDILGEPKMIDDYDEEGNRMYIGKGYIKPTGSLVATKYNKKTPKVQPSEIEDVPEIDLEDEDLLQESNSITRMLQHRAGII